MEPIQFTAPVGTFTYDGTNSDDVITLLDIPDVGGVNMRITGTGESVEFVNPTVELIIKGHLGSDTIT